MRKNKIIFGLLISIIIVLVILLFVSYKKREVQPSINLDLNSVQEDISEPKLDKCNNIEGVQTNIPINMFANSNSECLPVSKGEIPTNSFPSTKAPVVKIENTSPVVKENIAKENIDVQVFHVNTYDEVRGYNQYPASVGYKIKNSLNKAITIEGVHFDITQKGDSLIDGSTLYSVTAGKVEKTPAYYLSKDTLHRINYFEFPESITINANSSYTFYINVWNFSGDLRYYDKDKTIFTLISIDSLMKDINFNIGSAGLVTEIPHKQ